jgi:hypothetical protein
MASRSDPQLVQRLEKFGLRNFGACFNCGHCTATCSHTGGKDAFPRLTIQYAQLGLKDKLEESIEPWLCYYCGDCSTQCPREAAPGGQMMVFRRYLTSVYDWTGFSAKLYTSKAFEVGAVTILALLVVALFVVFHGLNPGHIPTELAVAPDGSRYVPLNTFAPVEWVHLADWLIAGLLGGLLLSNLYRMYRKILKSAPNLHIRRWLYVKQAWLIVAHFITQKQFSKCATPNKSFWAAHVFLMSGYIVMFSLVVLFLPQFQIDVEGINWTTFLGYYATLALIVGCAYFAVGRLRKAQEIHKESHFSDWMFLGLLALTVITGIVGHVFRFYLQWPLLTYTTYVVHLAVAVPMLLVEVPFGKWAHLIYRPFAVYFASVRVAAREESRVLAPAPDRLHEAA